MKPQEPQSASAPVNRPVGRIIQFQRDSQPGGPDWNAWDRLTVLCDDGSMWTYEYNNKSKKMEWNELDSYPPNAEDQRAARQNPKLQPEPDSGSAASPFWADRCNKCDNPSECHPDCPHRATGRASLRKYRCDNCGWVGVNPASVHATISGHTKGLRESIAMSCCPICTDLRQYIETHLCF